MPTAPKILAFSGSTRADSFNQRLVTAAAEHARAAGADVTLLSLRDYRMPLFDQDLEAEQGPPETARKLKQLMIEHQGLLIASPEYNSSITAVLKNTIDWVSRPSEGEAPGSMPAFRGKVALLLSASPGGLGGLRGLVHLRSILSNIGVLVLPDQLAVRAAHQAFTDTGTLADHKQNDRIQALAQTLTTTVQRLTS